MIVYSETAEWLGALVTVVEVSHDWFLHDVVVWSVRPHSVAGKRVRRIDNSRGTWDGKSTLAIPDNCLRPIRPGELEDDESTTVEKREPVNA